MTPEQAVVFMKTNKILQMKWEGFEVVLHPDALISDERPVSAPRDPKETEVGKTGMTRAQMRELFNQVFEEDFKAQ